MMPALLSLLLSISSSDERDDVDLARRIRSGDRAAFRVFFDRYHGMLFGYLMRRGIGRTICEDLIQNAFIKIWEQRTEIDPQRSIRALLFRIAYTRALNHFRDTSKFTDGEELAYEPSSSVTPASSAEHALMQERLHEVVKQLPERRRAVFELCFLDDLTYREAADVLGISIKTVENQMSAALKKLREAFERYRDI